MPRETFQQELDGLTSDLLDLGREVEASLENMVKAIEGRDADVARQELGMDIHYKTTGMDIERECIILQARQAPWPATSDSSTPCSPSRTISSGQAPSASISATRSWTQKGASVTRTWRLPSWRWPGQRATSSTRDST